MCAHGLNVGVIARGIAGGRERFASWTMMAVLCFSVDDIVLVFFRSIALLILVLVYSNSFRRRTKCVRLLTPRAKTTAAGTVAAGQRRLGVPTTPAGAAPSR